MVYVAAGRISVFFMKKIFWENAVLVNTLLVLADVNKKEPAGYPAWSYVRYPVVASGIRLDIRIRNWFLRLAIGRKFWLPIPPSTWASQEGRSSNSSVR